MTVLNLMYRLAWREVKPEWRGLTVSLCDKGENLGSVVEISASVDEGTLGKGQCHLWRWREERDGWT